MANVLILKVKLAEENGAAGVLIYMDPLEFSPFKDDRAYPNGLWLPKDGVQRGTLKIDGDVLTPGWPATGKKFLSSNVFVKCFPI